MKFIHGIKWIVYSNLWVSINVVALYLFSAIILHLQIDLRYAILIFFATLFAYNFQRLLKNSQSSLGENRSERHVWISDHQLLIKVLTGLGAIGGLVFSIWVLPPILLFASIPALIIVMLYARGKENLSALRNIPFLKVFLISFVWVFTVMIIPFFETGRTVNLEVTSYSIIAFLFVFILCIPFDIRDLKLDGDKLKTIPVVVGIKLSKYLASSVMLIIAVWAYLLGTSSLLLVALFVIPSIMMTQPERRELFFTGWIEGQFTILLLLQLAIELYD